jgi:hypothetical protein
LGVKGLQHYHGGSFATATTHNFHRLATNDPDIIALLGSLVEASFSGQRAQVEKNGRLKVEGLGRAACACSSDNKAKD